MKVLRLINVNLKKGLSSPGFYACIVLTMVMCFFSELFYDMDSRQEYSVIQAAIKYNRADMLGNIYFNAYNVLYKCTDGWLCIFVPIIAAFPYVPLICDERENGYIRVVSVRTTRICHNIGNFLSAMILGGLALLCGVAIFYMIIIFIFPDINEYEVFQRESFEWWFPGTYAAFSRMGYPYLIALRFIEIFLYGALSAVAAFVLTSFMKNKYLVLSVPFFIHYIMMQWYDKIYHKAYAAPGHPNGFLLAVHDITDLNMVRKIFSLGGEKWKNMLFYAAYVVVAYLLYSLVMNRRLDHGA